MDKVELIKKGKLDLKGGWSVYVDDAKKLVVKKGATVKTIPGLSGVNVHNLNYNVDIQQILNREHKPNRIMSFVKKLLR